MLASLAHRREAHHEHRPVRGRHLVPMQRASLGEEVIPLLVAAELWAVSVRVRLNLTNAQS
jgi:hypothetical protein